MTPLLRPLCSPALLVALLLALSVVAAPATVAQEATPPSTACTSPGSPLAGEEFPTGVVREDVLAQTPTLNNQGEATTMVVASSIVCFEPDTLVEIEKLPPGTFTTELPHRFTTTFVVTDGELGITLVDACVPAAVGGNCTGTDGTAYYYTHDAPTTQQTFGQDPVTLTTGDTVVLSNVTVQYQTPADQHARILVSGVYQDIDGGGCQRGCWFP